MTLVIDFKSQRDMELAIATLALPPKKRFWILKDLGRWEKRLAKSRIKRQKDVDNKKFEQRKRGKSPLLRGMADALDPIVINDAKLLKLTWDDTKKAKIAAIHNEGIAQVDSANALIQREKKRRGEPDYSAPCTKAQAVALRRLGYRIRRKKGKGWNKPSVRNIEKRLTLGQAGLIIRMLRKKKPKNAWIINVPKRKFLGSDDDKVRERLIRNIEKARNK
ncbi:hypothetical protein [Photobacterium damselae]|uniref:hypothetical protein n=1 Tax=Photobacterium damselae TaxID=38293 RepID=UPI001EFD2A40|nr:hypothetical protein [Photobacterium damselae]MCG9778725.1 hypothetical protein [Photobacterium damselae]